MSVFEVFLVRIFPHADEGKYGLFSVFVSPTRWRRDIKNTVLSVGPRVEKFNTVSNDHERTHNCDFSIFDRKYPSWANLFKKNQNCEFKLKFGSKINSNMQNSMVVFTFSILDGKNFFWANLVQKIKIVSLN